jgi:hypothetical protein
VVDAGSVFNFQDVHGSSILIDPVNEPVGTAPGAMTAG